MANQKYILAGAGCAVIAMVALGAGLLGVALYVGYMGPAKTPAALDGAPATEGKVEGASAAAPGKPFINIPGTDPLPQSVIDASHCDDMARGGKNDGCLTAKISCGDTVIGHTLGGVDRFNTAFYQKFFCTPSTTSHDSGDERVYRLEMPKGDWHAKIVLDSPCADLDVAAMEYEGSGCPTANDSVPRCEMVPKKGTEREKVEIVSQDHSTWLLVVEGKGDEEGVFALQVICEKGLY